MSWKKATVWRLKPDATEEWEGESDNMGELVSDVGKGGKRKILRGASDA